MAVFRCLSIGYMGAYVISEHPTILTPTLFTRSASACIPNTYTCPALLAVLALLLPFATAFRSLQTNRRVVSCSLLAIARSLPYRGTHLPPRFLNQLYKQILHSFPRLHPALFVQGAQLQGNFLRFLEAAPNLPESDRQRVAHLGAGLQLRTLEPFDDVSAPAELQRGVAKLPMHVGADEVCCGLLVTRGEKLQTRGQVSAPQRSVKRLP